jgi:hypothetical protein
VLLIFGIGLHIGIILFMGLFSFGVTMIGALILFLRPLDAELAAPAWLLLRLPRSRRAPVSGRAPASLAA